MSLAACISRCPLTTRSPWLSYSLGGRNRSSTDASACLACSSSGSASSRPRSSTIHARVPTLPTPTTLRAMCTYENSRIGWFCCWRVDWYDASTSRIQSSSCSRVRPIGSSCSIGTMSGGSAVIRSSPSTTSVSFATARMLSFVRAFASAASARFTCLSPSCFRFRSSARYAMNRSVSSWSYQASSTRDSAACSIRSR